MLAALTLCKTANLTPLKLTCDVYLVKDFDSRILIPSVNNVGKECNSGDANIDKHLLLFGIFSSPG